MRRVDHLPRIDRDPEVVHHHLAVLQRDLGDGRHLRAEGRGHGDSRAPGCVPSAAWYGPALPAAGQLGHRLQQRRVARAVLQQRHAELERIAPAGIGHLVEEALVEEVVHRMPDRAPEADGHRVRATLDVVDPPVRRSRRASRSSPSTTVASTGGLARTAEPVPADRAFADGRRLQRDRHAVRPEPGAEAREAQRPQASLPNSSSRDQSTLTGRPTALASRIACGNGLAGAVEEVAAEEAAEHRRMDPDLLRLQPGDLGGDAAGTAPASGSAARRRACRPR